MATTITPAAFTLGERVGILTGVQSVSGPHVSEHGTVVRYFASWNDSVEYVVRTPSGELVYPAYLLVREPTPDGLSEPTH